jgi:hypothetical protein
LTLVLATIYFAAFVFLMDFFPPPDANLNADQAAALYSHSNLKFRIGVWPSVPRLWHAGHSRHTRGRHVLVPAQGRATGRLIFHYLRHYRHLVGAFPHRHHVHA